MRKPKWLHVFWKWSLALALSACVIAILTQERPSKAETFAAHQIPTKGELVLKRSEWFFQQRAYPLRRLPAGARLRALQQLETMLAGEAAIREQAAELLGMTGAPSAGFGTTWALIGPMPSNIPRVAVDPGAIFFGTPVASGRVTALMVDPSDATNNTVYLGSAEGGVWKTTNGGTTWTPLTDQQKSLAVGSIALDPSNSSTVYVGTGEEDYSDSYYGAGILKSTNGGTSFTQFPGPFAGASGSDSKSGGAYIGSLSVSPDNGQILLAGVSFLSQPFTPRAGVSGIYRSTDGGQTWNAVLTGAPGTSAFFDPSTGAIAWAALGNINGNATNAVYKSTDGGMTWAAQNGTGANTLPSGTNAGRITLAIAPSTPTTLYAAIQDPRAATFGQLLGFFTTTDGGQNWTTVTNPHGCDPICWYTNVAAVVPGASNIVLEGGAVNGLGKSVLFISPNGGAAWNDVSLGTNGINLHADMHAIALSPDSTTLYIGNDGGVWSTTSKSTSNIAWNNLNAPLAISQFYPGMSIKATDKTFALGGTQDNRVQRYSGLLAWDAVFCGDGGWTVIDFIKITDVYTPCAGIPNDVFKSTSSGDPGTWSGTRNQLGNCIITSCINDTRRNFVPPLVIDPNVSDTLYYGGSQVWETTDANGSWTSISADLTAGAGTISTLACGPNNANPMLTICYAGTDDGRVQVAANVNPTAAAAANWNLTNGLPGRSVTAVAVSPADANTAYCSVSGFSGFTDALGHVFTRTAANPAWADISGNLPNIPVNDIVVDPDLCLTLYAATDVGVFFTADGGTRWQTLMSKLPRVAVLSLRLHEASRTLRAGTHGRSAWDLSVPNTSPSGITLLPTGMNFGNQKVGTQSPPQVATLTNTCTKTLNLFGIVTNDNFPMVNTATSCTRTLAPGQSCTISVTFAPKSVGNIKALLTVTDNGLGSPRTVNLSGVGTP